jgi:hypothetical protein
MHRAQVSQYQCGDFDDFSQLKSCTSCHLPFSAQTPSTLASLLVSGSLSGRPANLHAVYQCLESVKSPEALLHVIRECSKVRHLTFVHFSTMGLLCTRRQKSVSAVLWMRTWWETSTRQLPCTSACHHPRL